MLRSILDTYREAFSGLGRPVWLLSAAVLVNRAGTMVLPFLILYLTEEQGFSTPDAGRALGVYGLGGILGSYLGGWLCDRVPTRHVMAASLALTGIGFIVLGRLDSRPAILTAIFVLSVVAEAFRPANSAALALASPPELRTRAFTLNRLAINVGMAVGPTAGGFLAMKSYDWLFVADGLTCFVAAVLVAARFREPARKPREAGGAEPQERSPWRDRPFLAMMALFFGLALLTFQMISTFPLMLRDHYGFEEGKIGLVFAWNTLIIIAFEMILVHRVGGMDPVKLVGVGAFLFGAGLALLPFGSGFAYAAFTVAVWSVGEMLAFPLSAGAAAGRAGESNVGLYMGLYMLSFEGAWVFSPMLGTWVYHTWGARTLWLGCGALGVALLAGFYAVAAVIERERRAPA